jgi:hypothetical protein
MSGDESGAGFMVMTWIFSHPSGKANHVDIQKRQGRRGREKRRKHVGVL